MTTCPVCSHPMLAIRWRHPVHYCSRRCQYIGSKAVQLAHQMEMDEVVVLRLVSGSRVASTKAERLEATRQLTERGYSIVVIASRLHTTPRNVSRYRAELHRREVAA